MDRQAVLDDHLKLLYEQLAGQEKAMILASSEEKERLKQQISALKSLIKGFEQEKQQLMSNNNLSKLKKLLEIKDWKNADLETKDLILISSGYTLNSCMSPDIILNASCSILVMIDKLWMDLTGGHFGFTIQIEIYKKLNRNHLKWSKEVGWRDPLNPALEVVREKLDRAISGWLPYESLQFNLNAPKGHLPALGKNGYGNDGKLPLLAALEEKLEKCRQF